MSDLFTTQKKYHLSQQLVDKWIFCVLIAVIAVVPLLFGGHGFEVVSPNISLYSSLSSGTKGNMFSYFKFITLVTLTILAFLLFLYKLFFIRYSFPKSLIFIFLTVFMIAILISTMVSPTKTIALYGQFKRLNGAISYLCYVLLMLIAINIKYPKKAVEYVFYALYPLVIINFIITTMNFTGHDALSFKIIRDYMTMFLPNGDSLSKGSFIVGTFDHPNYMSSLFSVITVMYLSWVVIDQNNIRRLINLMVALLSVSTMLMATSQSGFLTFICITPFIIWIACRALNKKKAIISMAVFYVLSATILPVLVSKNPRVWEESVGMLIPTNPFIEKQPEETSFKKVFNGRQSKLLDHRVYEAERFTLPVLPEQAWTAGTGRVYIWKETLKLVKDRPLFGYGLDTLVYHFPQYNIEARANLYNVTIVDKPHSFYMDVLYGTGIIGFLGFLGFMSLIGWKSFQQVFHFNETSGIVVTLCIAWLAFLIQALFNDSKLGITSTLFTIAGIMMGLLLRNKELENS